MQNDRKHFFLHQETTIHESNAREPFLLQYEIIKVSNNVPQLLQSNNALFQCEILQAIDSTRFAQARLDS